VKIARHLVIRGRVQGVWYRESMRLEAERLGVTGWVRNRRDGTVEACVQGEAHAVDTLLAWARRGPPAARVEEVQVNPAEIGPYQAFLRLPTV
jgi:acylphosphatase